MKKLMTHGPIWVFLQGLTFLCFGHLMDTPIWHGMDGDILCDASVLSSQPLEMLGHLGFYFSQPILQLLFLLEFKLFGLNSAPYIAVNLFVHAGNAFMVYMLVNMLFPRKSLALLAATLFALGVGNYGKIFMTVNNLESLVLAQLHLLVLYFFIRNDYRHGGRLTCRYFVLGLLLFVLSGLTKATSFSLILSLAAYKLFFNPWNGGRVLLSRDLMAIVVVGFVFHLAQGRWGYQHPTVFGSPEGTLRFSLLSIKNLFRYLNLMFFPMQQSPILEHSSRWVVLVYETRTIIRVLLTLSILSYSFFGFIFGSKAIRFFLAWTFISLLPFTGHTETGQWLNLNHLYLTSLGFCITLAAGVEGTSGLLRAKPSVRWVPYLAPAAFVALSLGMTVKLDQANRAKARSPQAVEMREHLESGCP